MLEPACLGCLQPLTKMDQATVHFCEKCNLPLCTPNCEFLAQHESQECQIFSEGKLMLDTKIDTTKPSSIYTCIAIVRMMLKLYRSTFIKTFLVDLVFKLAKLKLCFFCHHTVNNYSPL